MRVFASCVALALCAACGHPTAPADAPAGASDAIEPAHVMRVRTELPAGYEVADLGGRASPLAFWGLGPQWTADPTQCGALAEPVAGDASEYGWSASGPGGIVYAVVVEASAELDPALVGQCGTWTVSAGHTSGQVTMTSAPAVERADTVAMVTDAATVVEGGTETHSRADTYSAYLGGHFASVTVVTDPGADTPTLGPEFASTLLAKTVSAIRGRVD